MKNTQARENPQWHRRGARGAQEATGVPALSPSRIPDIRFAAPQMTGTARRAFEAEMSREDGHGSARWAETRLGWSRKTVAVGLAEDRTGLRCIGAQAAWRGVAWPQAVGGEVSGSGGDAAGAA